MAGVTYDVAIQFRSLGMGELDRPNAKLKDLKSSFDHLGVSAGGMFTKLGSAVGSLNSRFDQLASSAVGTLTTIGATAGGAIVGALALATHEAIKFNEQLETASISLGTISVMNGLSGALPAGIQNSSNLISRMQQDARELPGSFREILDTQRTIASVTASQFGMGSWKTEDLSAKIVSSAHTLGVGTNVAGRETNHILSGSARSTMPYFQRLGLGDAKEWNHLSGDERLKRFTEKLDSASVANKAFQNSWAGLTSSAGDVGSQLLGQAGKPLFNAAKSELAHLLEYVDSNRGRFDMFAEHAGSSLARMFNGSVGFAKHAAAEWYNPVHHFLIRTEAGFERLEKRIAPIFARVSPLLHKALDVQDPVGAAMHGASTLLALRAGSGALGMGLNGAGSLLSAAGPLTKLGPAIGPAVTALGGIGTAGPMALAAIVGLGAELGILSFGVAGAASALTNFQSAYHDQAAKAVASMGDSAGKVGTSLSRLWEVTRPLAERFGANGLEAAAMYLGIFSNTLENATTAVQMLGTAATWSANLWERMKGNDVSNTGQLWGSGEGGIFRLGHILEKLDSTSVKEKTDFGARAPQHTTHVHGGINIQVSSNQDPSRIAKHTFEELQAVLRHPLVSAYDPNHRFVR